MILHLSSPSVFLLGLLCFAVPVAPEARIILADILAVILLVTQHRSLGKTRQVRHFISLFLIYQAAMLLSAIIHDLPAINFFRRSYTVSLLLIESLFLYCLIRTSDKNKLLAMIFGIMAGICMNYFYPVDDRISDFPFKFLIGVPIGILITAPFILIVRSRLISKVELSIIFFGYSIFCFLIGNRAIGGIFLISSLILWGRFMVAQQAGYRKIFPLYLALGITVIYCLSLLYTNAAINGFFGETARDIALFQSGLFGNILLGGRPEILANLAAVLDSPIIGHGPIAEKTKYLDLLISMGAYSEGLIYGAPELVYHSMLFSTAQEGGVLATLFWVFVVYKLIYAIPIMISGRQIAYYACMPILFVGVWHVLFSPLVPYSRWLVALAVSLAFLASDHRVIALRSYSGMKFRQRRGL